MSSTAEEHEEQLPRDLVVRGTPNALNQFWARLERGRGDWRRNRSFEREHAKMTGEGEQDLTRVFLYVGTELPACALWLFRKDDKLEVTNIVPKGARLEPPVYNELAARFVADILEPRASEDIKIEFGAEDVRLEDLVSKATAQALRSFSDCANKKTGNAHPSDNRRWVHFVRLAHHEDSDLDAPFLTQWLLNDGWGERWAGKLGDRYESQRDVLGGEAVEQLTTATDKEWRNTLSVMRSAAVVVLIDACAYLDLARLPVRLDTAQDCKAVLAAVADVMKRAARSTNKFALTSLESVHAEVKRNRDNAFTDTRQKLNTSLRHVEILRALDAMAKGDLPSTERALKKSEELIDKLLAASTMFSTPEEIRKRAFSRSTTRVAPASAGKESLIDCAIAETALELGRTLGSKTTIYLLSPNTKDFAGADLVHELAHAHVTYVRSWQELAGRLKSGRSK